MPGFYFFTDMDLLSNQTAGNEYGAENGNVFKTTSLHSSSNTTKAYAICRSKLMVQEVTNNSELVNIILSPVEQPRYEVGYISFFIYRGIRKSSLINGDIVATATTNHLTQHIWDTQQLVNEGFDELNDNAPGTTTTLPSINSLGVNLSANGQGGDLLSDDTQVESFFFQESSFSPVVIEGGWHIGDFNPDSFGLDIIKQKLSFRPTFGMIRTLEYSVQVTATNPLEQKREREAVLSFLDPCAFFGSFAKNNLKGKKFK